jgi:hypothetical protein
MLKTCVSEEVNRQSRVSWLTPVLLGYIFCIAVRDFTAAFQRYNCGVGNRLHRRCSPPTPPVNRRRSAHLMLSTPGALAQLQGLTHPVLIRAFRPFVHLVRWPLPPFANLCRR